MPLCNLAKIMHQKWLTQSRNKMTCIYEATMYDMIRVFIQISNYCTWLKGGQQGRRFDKATLKLKATIKNGDPKMLKEVMKSLP